MKIELEVVLDGKQVTLPAVDVRGFCVVVQTERKTELIAEHQAVNAETFWSVYEQLTGQKVSETKFEWAPDPS